MANWDEYDAETEVAPRHNRKMCRRFLEPFYKALTLGARVEDAARYARIAPTTVRDWIAEGERGIEEGDPSNPCISFVRKIDEIRGLRVVKRLGLVEKGAKGDWRAAKFLLELDGYGSAMNGARVIAKDGDGKETGSITIVFDDQDRDA